MSAPMPQNPNAPTNPIFANTLNNPNMAVLPENNTPLPEHELNQHSYDVHQLMFQLQENVRKQDVFRGELAKLDPNDPQYASKKAYYDQGIANYDGERQRVSGNIADIAANSDTSAILDVLYNSVGAAREHTDTGHERRNRTHNAAVAAGRLATAAVVERYNESARAAAAGPIPGAPQQLRDAAREANFQAATAKRFRRGKSKRQARNLDAAEALADAPRDRAAAYHQGLRRVAAHEMLAYRDASAADRHAEIQTAHLGSYEQALAGIYNHVNNERNQRMRSAAEALDRANGDLELWDFGQQPGSGDLISDIQNDISDATTAINELSKHDPERARLHQNLVRLRYRLHSRELAADPTSGAGEYQPDKGILIDGGTPNGVTLYEDGTTARNEQDQNGHFSYIRRDAMNREVPTGTVQLPEIPANEPHMGLQTAYRNWDTQRTPDATAHLHRELDEEIRRYEAQEQGVMQALHDIHQQIRNQTNVVKSVPPAQKRAANTELQRLKGIQDQNQNRLATIRTHINPLQYFKHYITIGTNREQNAFITPFGSIIHSNIRINGEQRAWELLPDGTAHRR